MQTVLGPDDEEEEEEEAETQNRLRIPLEQSIGIGTPPTTILTAFISS